MPPSISIFCIFCASKFVNSSKKFHAHDEKNVAKKGDSVTIIESRPYPKLKKWELLKVN